MNADEHKMKSEESNHRKNANERCTTGRLSGQFI